MREFSVPDFGDLNQNYSSIRDIPEPEPEYNAIETGLAALDLGVKTSISEELSFITSMQKAKIFNPGNLMTEEDWKKSGYYSPGLHFNDIKNGDNLLGENVAKMAYDRFKSKKDAEEIIAKGPKHWGAKAAQMIGGGYAFITDPLNAIMTVAAPQLGPIRYLGAAAKTANLGKFANFAAKTGIFTAEVGIAIAPDSAAKFAADYVGGENPNFGDALAEYATNVALGAPLYIAGSAIGKAYSMGKAKYKAYRGVTPETHTASMEAAVSQKAQGKKVDVADILMNGVKQAREARGFDFTGLSVEEVAALKERVTELEGSVSQKQAEYAQLQDAERLKRVSQGLEQETQVTKRSEGDLRQQINEVLSKDKAVRTASDRTFIKDMEANFKDLLKSEVEALDISKKEGFLRSASERVALKGREKASLSEDILRTEGGLDSVALTAKRAEINEAAAELRQIATLIGDSEIIASLERMEVPEVTSDMLQAMHERLDSHKSNSSFSQEKLEQYKEKVESIDKSIDQAQRRLVDAELEDLMKRGVLSEEEIQVIRDANQSTYEAETIGDSLESIINCLIENDL